MAFKAKELSVSVSLSSGNFTQGGDTVNLSGFRTSAYIENAGGLSDGTLDLTVYGMSRSLMNQLSTLGMQINLVPKNPIELKAGEEGNLATAFNGYIIAAYADYNASPEVAFHISAHTLAAFATAAAESSSFRGPVDVATVMSGFATKMGLRFENNGVQVKLPNCYFSGSLRNQARACVKQSGISWNNGEGGILSIWPRKGSRGGQIPVIAPPPKGSMIGYPTYTAYGIILRNLYDPTLGLGQKISVESSVLNTAKWQIYSISHNLESQVVKGKWESTISAYNPLLPSPPVR